MMKVVVVESPAKAKTINKYLGSDYTVLASYGHVRDLPAKDGSVNPDEQFSMIWQIDPNSEKHIKDIATSLKKADELLLATDQDREGEAISWHVMDILQQRSALKGKKVKRVVFNEVTQNAILDAVAHPRDLDQALIDAYLTRRALDYLVGFNLSPILWRKLPGSRSAGRVQSVALRLITEREDEIEAFDPQEYWTILADCLGSEDRHLEAKLTHLHGEKLGKFAIKDEAAAQQALAEINKHLYHVDSIEKKQVKRNPAPPFTTSTLQQEASRKLGFGASRTMRTAQQLYEGINLAGETTGLITYMRTDSVQLSQEALTGSRKYIQASYGDKYLPEKPRVFKSKVKNAQEAHEAIRPTDVSRHPRDIATFLSDDQRKLYELVWKRMVASQMTNAILDQVGINVASPDQNVIFRANGSTIAFDGFFKVYRESFDDAKKQKEDDEKMLPRFEQGEKLDLEKVTPNQHFTQPPPRYTEASLVKKLEELGIGRPSTYASIIRTLQDRDYVRLERRQFHPEDRGRIVTAFLLNFFKQYIEYDFTAGLEDQLDEVSGGKLKWTDILNKFWRKFNASVEEAKGLTITQVIDRLNEDLKVMLFPEIEPGKDPRVCLKCGEGQLSLKLGKFGAFIGCSSYPDCKYTRKLGEPSDSESAVTFEPKELGVDPKTDLKVTLRKGPYGFYFQWGEPEGKKKPKRVALPKQIDPDDANLNIALGLGALPRVVGVHPETSEEIVAAIGRFGPYLKYQGKFTSIKGDDEPTTITLERAVEVIAQAPKRKPRAKANTNTTKKKRTVAKKKAPAKKTVRKKKGVTI
ncbi:MAG: type I DNA topoisomerase [Pseudomonadota bacterium]